MINGCIKIAIASFVGCLLLSCTPKGNAADGFSQADFLRVKDTLVINATGNPVRLNGTNLGGWLLRECWMDPVGYFSPDSIGRDSDDYSSRKIMQERFGEEMAEELLEFYQQVYIQESDLDEIKSFGLNFVRVPIYWQEILDWNGEVKEGAFNQLDWIVDACNARRIYVILDLHGAPGGHSDGYQTGGQTASNELWTNRQYQQMTVKIWELLASRYKNNPTVMAYDLLNEPVSSVPDSMSVIDMYDMLYQAVRKIDTDHIIMMGAFYNFDVLCPPADMGWEHVVYQTHHYNAEKENRVDWESQYDFIEATVRYLSEYKRKWNVPIYAGEYNFGEFTDLWEKWMNALTNEGIVWSNWAYKNVDMQFDNNWGFFLANNNPRPDLRNDFPEDFRAKWSKFSTDYYYRNERLMKVVSECTEYAKSRYSNK